MCHFDALLHFTFTLFSFILVIAESNCETEKVIHMCPRKTVVANVMIIPRWAQLKVKVGKERKMVAVRESGREVIHLHVVCTFYWMRPL